MQRRIRDVCCLGVIRLDDRIDTPRGESDRVTRVAASDAEWYWRDDNTALRLVHHLVRLQWTHIQDLRKKFVTTTLAWCTYNFFFWSNTLLIKFFFLFFNCLGQSILAGLKATTRKATFATILPVPLRGLTVCHSSLAFGNFWMRGEHRTQTFSVYPSAHFSVPQRSRSWGRTPFP